MTHILIFIHWFVLVFTFGNVELVTIDNSKSNDFPIEELNNYTLREVFEDGNLVPNGNLLTLIDFDLWLKNAQVTFDSVNNRTVIDTTEGVNFRSPMFTDKPSGRVIYTVIDGYATNENALSFRYLLDDVIDSQIINITIKTNRGLNTYIHTYTNAFDQFAIARYGVNQIAYIYDIKYIDLTSLDLSSLTVEQMNDWFSVYQENAQREISETYDYIENELTTNDLIYIVLFALLWGLAIKIVKGVM